MLAINGGYMDNNLYKDYLDNNQKNNHIILNIVLIILLMISVILFFFLNKKDRYDISLKEKEVIVEKGKNFQLNTNNQKLQYKILDSSIAHVDKKGNISGIKEGNTNLIVTSNDNNYKVIKVLVKNLEKNDKEIISNEIEENQKIQEEENKEIKEESKVIFEEKKENIIKTETAIVQKENKELKEESKVILEDKKEDDLERETIFVQEEKKKEDVEQTILKPEIIKSQEIKLNYSSKKLYVGDGIKLVAEILPKNSTNKEIVWKSSNKEIASIDSNGYVKALKTGNVEITAINGNIKSICTIIVKNKNNIISWKDSSEKSVAGGGASRVYSLSNGKLVGGSERDDKIYTVVSVDNGKTWSKPVMAASIENTTAANINFFYDANKLYMAYRATRGCDNSRSKCYTSLHVNVSYDEGRTWKYHSKIVENTMSNKSNNRGYWEPYLGIINGKLTVFYANDITSGSWQNIESLTWNGTSWTNKKIISNGKNHNSRDGMPSWIKLSNGSYALVIESTKYQNKNHPFVIQMLTSRDGINWSSPKDIYIPKGNGSRAAAPGIAELANGQIVVSFQTDEDSNRKGNDYTICKTIYSEGTKVENITTSNFSKSERVFDSTSGMWPGINYNDGWLYIAGGSKYKKLKIN